MLDRPVRPGWGEEPIYGAAGHRPAAQEHSMTTVLAVWGAYLGDNGCPLPRTTTDADGLFRLLRRTVAADQTAMIVP